MKRPLGKPRGVFIASFSSRHFTRKDPPKAAKTPWVLSKGYFTVTSLTVHSANEMTLHVNSAHLEYLTPEREDVAFLEDYESMSDFDSIWQLEKVSFFTYIHCGPSMMLQ